jgi:hypothetical protein
MNGVTPRREYLQALRDQTPNWSDAIPPNPIILERRLLVLVNRLTVAYSHVAAGKWISWGHVFPIQHEDLMARLKTTVYYLCSHTHTPTEEEIVSACKVNGFYIEAMQASGDRPYDEFRLLDHDAIQRAVLAQQLTPFYDFALQADTYFSQDEVTKAVLMIVVALEGAHGAFVRRELGKRLKDANDSESTINQYVREIGFHSLIQTTPYLLMDGPNCPTADELEMVKTAVEFRNAVMHQLVAKGKARMHKYDESELRKAYRATWNVYRKFTTILDRDEKVSE